MFDISPKLVGKVDAVWDRGSFVALSFDIRPRYADLLKTLVANSHFRQVGTDNLRAKMSHLR